MYPTSNRFAALSANFQEVANKQVQDQLAQRRQQQEQEEQRRQQRQLRQQQQEERLRQQQQQLWRAVRRKLTDNRFRAAENTYVHALNARVRHANQNVGTHLTINIADLEGQISQGNPANRTAVDVLQRTGYHVTVEEYDEHDVKNPRWYSDGNRWVTKAGSDFHNTNLAGLQMVQAAIAEANGVIARVQR